MIPINTYFQVDSGKLGAMYDGDKIFHWKYLGVGYLLDTSLRVSLHRVSTSNVFSRSSPYPN
jgi:hypothetical protein